MARTSSDPALDVIVDINATPRAIVDAFFKPGALSAWWGTTRSVTSACVLGAYALEWPVTTEVDPVLGRLGGVLHGTVMQYEATRRILRGQSVLASARRRPDRTDGARRLLRDVSGVRRPAGNEAPHRPDRLRGSARWRRYYERLQEQWPRSLETLRALVEV